MVSTQQKIKAEQGLFLMKAYLISPSLNDIFLATEPAPFG